jgi:hypothetical protein
MGGCRQEGEEPRQRLGQLVQMVSKEGDPDEFGRLGRAFEGISCNFENWLLMLKSYLEIPNMWSIPTFYPRPYLVFFCFLPANNASSENIFDNITCA